MAVCNEQVSQPIDLIARLLVASLFEPLQVLGELGGAVPGRGDVVAERGRAPAGIIIEVRQYRAGRRGAPVVMQPEGAEIELILLLGLAHQWEIEQVEVLEDLEEEGFGLGEGAVEVGEDEGLEEGFELHG